MMKEVVVMYKEDYLKVVESDKSKEELNIIYYNRIKQLEEELKEKEETIEELVDTARNGMNRFDVMLNKMKEKDEEIRKIKENNEVLLSLIEKKNGEIERLENSNRKYCSENERMKNLYEPEKQYEDWCELTYWWTAEKTGDANMFKQHMLYEDACELIGMDSDNWNEFNVLKYKKEVK